MRIGRLALVGIALAVLVTLVALPATAQVKDYRKIKYPSLPEFKIAQPEVYILENGMTIFLLEDRELPFGDDYSDFVRGMLHDTVEKDLSAWFEFESED